MTDPKIRTKVAHSESKNAWNIIGAELGKKYKIATVPYVISGSVILDSGQKTEAFEHANFISACFNNSGLIFPFIK